MEKISVGCSVPNRNPINMFNKLKLEEVVNLIKAKGYTKEIEEDLIEIARKRPSNSYEGFLKNINSYIAKIKEKYERKNKRKEEAGGKSDNSQRDQSSI